MGLLLVAYGTVSLWTGQGSTASPRTLRRAQVDLAKEPASADRWADLAEAEVDENELDHGRFSMRQAMSAAPGEPVILFRAAALYLRLEDYGETFQSLNTILRNPELASYYDQAFALYSQIDLPLSALLDKGVPRTPQAANAFLRFWINQNKLEEADETWKWINAQSLTSVQSAGSYVALLAHDGRWEEAEHSWTNYTARLDPAYRKDNYIYNGKFEMNPVECPFDWRLKPVGNVAVAREAEQGDGGNTSLRLTFSGMVTETAPAYQMVYLEPGSWEVRARIKTVKLTSDQGVVIRVVDAYKPEHFSVMTGSIEGTADWTEVSAKFEVKPDTRLLRVEVAWPASREFDSRLRGTAWVDSVELRPLMKVTLINAARLSQAGQPCEDHGNCGNGEGGVQEASK